METNMKKSLLALAVLGAFAGGVSAQTSVTIYGVVDGGLVVDYGAPKGTTVKLGTGVWSSNRLGFKGSEDLGGGLKAIFQLENGFNLDTGTLGQGGLLFGRQAFAGLTGGFGTVTFGRQYTPLSWAQYVNDPFDAGSAGATYNLQEIAEHRRNNTVRYQNGLNGFLADVSYSFGEQPGNFKAGRQADALVGYENGPVSVKLGYFTKTNVTDTVDTTKTLLTAAYDFTVVKAYLQYAVNKGEGTYTNGATRVVVGGVLQPDVLRAIDNKDLMVGLTAPVSAVGTFRASYIRRDDKLAANQDAEQFAIGYTHVVSKRTMLYAVYARIKNKNGALYTVGNSSDAGTGDKQLNLGIRHTF
jgi:predicted porin